MDTGSTKDMFTCNVCVWVCVSVNIGFDIVFIMTEMQKQRRFVPVLCVCGAIGTMQSLDLTKTFMLALSVNRPYIHEEYPVAARCFLVVDYISSVWYIRWTAVIDCSPAMCETRVKIQCTLQPIQGSGALRQDVDTAYTPTNTSSCRGALRLGVDTLYLASNTG